MKLDQRTLAVLKNFAGVNTGIVVKPGSKLRTISPLKSVLAEAELDQPFDQGFAIYDLPRFLSTLSLFNEPELEFGSTNVTIRSGKAVARYAYAAESTITQPPEKTINYPSAAATVQVSWTTLAEAFKALGVMKLPELAFKGDGSTVRLVAMNSKDNGADTWSVEVGETDSTFTAIFLPENLKLLQGDYTIDLSAGISRWTAPGVSYAIAVQAESKFN